MNKLSATMREERWWRGAMGALKRAVNGIVAKVALRPCKVVKTSPEELDQIRKILDKLERGD